MAANRKTDFIHGWAANLAGTAITAGKASDPVDVAWKRLMAGVCLQACLDYKKAVISKDLNDKKRIKTIQECREFFGGELFQSFVNDIPVIEIEKSLLRIPYHNLKGMCQAASRP